MAKRALITGITGQDGSYLAELLLGKGYEVHGIQRRTSTITTGRVDHLLNNGLIQTHYADLSDANSLIRVLLKVQPDEIYNLASMSHVRISFDIPLYTGDVTGLAPARWLESLLALGMRHVKFYQASSSEMFGVTPPPQNENTAMLPVSPYGCAKLYAYHMTRSYRFGHDMFAANGILFNHESPRRGENFVTKKIVRAACRIKLGLQNTVQLGNLHSMRDWGFAGDYVRAIWMIMQHDKPDDWVVATEEQHSIYEFAELVFAKLDLDFKQCVQFNAQYLRPNEVPSLCGDPSKIRTVLGWKPEVDFNGLVDMMIGDCMQEERRHMYVGSQI